MATVVIIIFTNHIEQVQALAQIVNNVSYKLNFSTFFGKHLHTGRAAFRFEGVIKLQEIDLSAQEQMANSQTSGCDRLFWA